MSRLFRDVASRAAAPQSSVVCIGAFDGLHLGHQALVRHAVDRARASGIESVALTFDPLPREYFAREGLTARLMSTRSRIAGLYALGIDRVGLLRFDAVLAATSAEQFCSRVLADAVGAAEVWVGPAFRFGHGRAGDLDLMQREGARQGFVAGGIEPVSVQGARVSSTRIRSALANGDFETARALLGRPYLVEGRVVRGRQLGRTLGYPTANLRLPHGAPPLSGIFATRVHGLSSRPLASVSSLGTRPTIGGIEPLLEAHIFDFDADIYTRRIGIEFVSKLRDEVKFDDLDALVEQMHRDAAQARDILAPDLSRLTA